MVLVDSSIWIEYFKGNERVFPLNDLIDTNNVCINDLIRAELIPSINQKREEKLKSLLLSLYNNPLNINWYQIIHMQTVNLRSGINNVGIPDLIIARNAIESNLELYSLGKHFHLMSKLHGLKIFGV